MLVMASCITKTRGKTKAPTPPSRCPIALIERQLPTFTNGSPRAKHRKYGNSVMAKGAEATTARFPSGMVRSRMDKRRVPDAPAPTSRLINSFLRAVLGSGNEDIPISSVVLAAEVPLWRRAHESKDLAVILLEGVEEGGRSWSLWDCGGAGEGCDAPVDDKGGSGGLFQGLEEENEEEMEERWPLALCISCCCCCWKRRPGAEEQNAARSDDDLAADAAPTNSGRSSSNQGARGRGDNGLACRRRCGGDMVGPVLCVVVVWREAYRVEVEVVCCGSCWQHWEAMNRTRKTTQNPANQPAP